MLSKEQEVMTVGLVTAFQWRHQYLIEPDSLPITIR